LGKLEENKKNKEVGIHLEIMGENNKTSLCYKLKAEQTMLSSL
jgi:hypothetical protein